MTLMLSMMVGVRVDLDVEMVIKREGADG